MTLQNPLHLRRLMRQTIKDVSIRFFRTSSFFPFLNPPYFNKLLLHCLKNGKTTKKTAPDGTVFMVSWKGFEPLTVRLEGGSSIQLSYQDTCISIYTKIEPSFQGS